MLCKNKNIIEKKIDKAVRSAVNQYKTKEF